MVTCTLCRGMGGTTKKLRMIAGGVVRTSVATHIRAPRDAVVALFLDYARWPFVFPRTIERVALVRRDAFVLEVMVRHRREGLVPNVLTIRGPGVVELFERKPRYDASFVNHFEHSGQGTRYRIDAELRLRRPWSLLAPFLRGVVSRALQRYTLEPMRVAAEAEGITVDERRQRR
jgi:hypothetical protein